MMAEMSRPTPNLDQLMNEGVAFILHGIHHKLNRFTVGQYPVMLGRRKPQYDTIDKVMKRLNVIYTVVNAINFVTVDIQ